MSTKNANQGSDRPWHMAVGRNAGGAGSPALAPQPADATPDRGKPCTILAINPGSTSTKIAAYEGERPQWVKTLRHTAQELAPFRNVLEQRDYRLQVLRRCLDEAGLSVQQLDAVVGRGGLVRPIPSGVYLINETMIRDLHQGAPLNHASSLGALMARILADEAKCPAFVVDPPVVDELGPLARYTGWKDVHRRSIFHALNQKAVARKAAAALGREYPDLRLVVAHLGGGITVGAHVHGQVVDVNNGLDGEGPFTPERSGALPVAEVIRLCFSGQYSQEEMLRRLAGQGGLISHLGTSDAQEVEKRIDAGDAYAAEIYEAMAYWTAKQIGAAAVVLEGQVDAVVLTGGLAYSRRFVEWIRRRVRFIAPVLVFPGENEMEALALGALRVLRGQEAPLDYPSGKPLYGAVAAICPPPQGDEDLGEGHVQRATL